MNQRTGKIICISAPSGTGKTTIIKAILKEFPDLVYSVSATTRKKREHEIDGKDYFFISEEQFIQRLKNKEFVEWEKMYDYYYGTFKNVIDENINSGKNILLEVDVNGSLSVKKIYASACLIYIEPPSFEELINRLKNRKTESDEDFNKRIERAKLELELKEKFDYFVVNNKLQQAIEDLKNTIIKIIKENN